MSALPVSAVLATWLQAHRSGHVRVDDLVTAVRGADPRHLVLWPDGVGELSSLPQRLAGRVSIALPVPGDALGLAGPSALNVAAIEAGEAVVVGAEALVPVQDARTVVWHVHDASPAPWIDDREGSVALRATLADVTRQLVELDVASWQPEIPDLLLNLRHREPLPLPPGYDAARVAVVERAVLCREVVELALDEAAGPVTASELERRRAALAELDRAARRALVGACSSRA